MSVRTGIAPNELLDTDPEIFGEMVRLLVKEQQ